MGVVYSISFDGSRGLYVGSAVELRSRMRSHMHLLRQGRHHSVGLQRAVEKYGLDKIKVDVLEDGVEPNRLIEREQAWMDRNVGRLYNRSPLAKSRLGLSMPEESKAKISASLIGNQYRKGILHDAGARAKIAAGVRLANAEGRRKNGPPQPQNLAAYNKAVQAGERINPRRNPERDAAIVAMHAETKSLKMTGLAFGITAAAVWCVVRRVNPAQIRKWTRK